MRILLVGMVSGLAALVGFAGAASASSIDLLWAANGTPTTIDVTVSSDVQLDVWFTDSGTGTVGGGVTVDYGDSGKITVVSMVSNPDGHFATTLGTTTDTGTQVRNINGLNGFGNIAGTARVGSIVFHKEDVPGNVNLQVLFTATDAFDLIDAVNGAQLVNTPEPGALSLLAMGFGGLILGRNRKS